MFALPWNVSELSRTLAGQNRKSRKETPISLRKRSLLFLTVDATHHGKQAFSHVGCNIFHGLSYSEANNTDRWATLL